MNKFRIHGISISICLGLGLIILLNQVYGGGLIENSKEAKLRAKETVKHVEKLFGPVQNQPEVLNERDIYNQTFYDCFNYGVAYSMELFGEPNTKFEDQYIEECHFFYNETGIWIGQKGIENINFSELKFTIANKKLSDIRQQDQTLESEIRAHQNDTIFDKLAGLFTK